MIIIKYDCQYVSNKYVLFIRNLKFYFYVLKKNCLLNWDK